MPIADLMIENPRPATLTDAKCKHCIHFKDVPHYRINGRPTVCSGEGIDRRRNSVPCPNFSLNLNILLTMSPQARSQISTLLRQLNITDAKRTKTKTNEDTEALEQLSLILQAIVFIRRTGFKLGANYTIAEQNITGKLEALNKTHGVIRDSSGVTYTVSHSILHPAVEGE